MFQFPVFNEMLFYIIAYILPAIPIGALIFKDLKLRERIILGIPLSMFIVTFTSFLLTYLIPFGFITLIISLASPYIFIAYLIFTKKEKLEEIKQSLSIEALKEGVKNNLFSLLIFIAVLIIALLSFYIRFQSASPIFFELDPYYYLYTGYQLLTLGEVPVIDDTAWYPNPSTHRVTPLLSHFYALPYKFLFNEVDIYKLSFSAHLYPPFAFSIMLLLIYIIASHLYDERAGLLAVFLSSLNEIFLTKTLSGVFEAQPMGFLLLTYSLTMLILYFKYKKKEFAYSLAIAIAFTNLASNFFLMAVGLFILSSLVYSFYLFLKENKEELLKLFEDLKYIEVIIIFSYILLKVFYQPLIQLKVFSFIGEIIFLSLPILSTYIFLFIIENLSKNKEYMKYKKYVLPSLIFLALILMFTPIGDVFKAPVREAFSIAQYNTVLERTIAEQQAIGESIYSFVGRFGEKDEFIINVIFSTVYNVFSEMFYFILNQMGMAIEFTPKEPSLALTVITLSIILLFYRAIKGILNEDIRFLPIFLLVLLFVMGGALKSKYGILLSYAFLFSFLTIFGELLNFPSFVTKLGFIKEEEAHLISNVIFIILLLFLFQRFTDDSWAYLILYLSKYKSFADSPYDFEKTYTAFCSSKVDEKYCAPLDEFLNKVYNQYDALLCYQTLGEQLGKDGEDFNRFVPALRFRCGFIPYKWMTSMEFISTTEKGSRITSWWDYGHWINYFGQRNSVLRNEHSYLDMILDIADAFVMKDEENLKEVMKKYDSKYVLIDDEIIKDEKNVFGSKFYALNYLACAKNNLTDVSLAQLESKCEYDNLWEMVLVSPQQCIISNITDKKGLLTYRIVPVVTSEGIKRGAEPYYCLGKTKLIDGKEIPALYYLNKTNELGELKLNKGFLAKTERENLYVVIYTKDPVWIEDGKVVSGWEDRKGRFYDSVIYKGFVLGELEGFDKVFDNKDIKIYKIKE